MGFVLLGPVEAWSGGLPVAVGPPRQRLLLAALAVDAGQVVPAETLVDRVWGEDPPLHARRTLHSYVARLRRVVEQVRDAVDRPAAVVGRSGGYLLDVGADEVDVDRFHRLLEQARSLPSAEQQLGVLREAVGLWRGEPLTGLLGGWAERMRRWWQQERVDAVVAWAHAEVEAGTPQRALGPVAELAGRYPLVEPLAAAQMRALAGCGRLAEALDCYRAMRDRLAEELGAEPSPQLQAVHLAVLRGEPVHPAGPAVPAAAGPAPSRPPADSTGRTGRAGERGQAGRVPPPAAAPVPAQLPADVSGFAGRTEPLARLDALLTAAADRGPTAVVISAVSGTAGVGKTALAVHWAHRVAGRFPDGQLYVNLRGFDPAGQVMEPATAVRGFLDALGVPAHRVPADPHAQTALYRSLLASKRMLVVLDNARDADQVRPLLPGAPTTMALVTSRNLLTPLVATDGAHPITLDLLPAVEAGELLARRLGADRTAAEPAAAAAIVAACARLPLALSIAAARAAQTGFHLTDLAAELADAAGRLAALDAGDPATRVRTVFSWSYQALTPSAARLFRLIGLHPGPALSAPAAASLAALPPAEATRLLTELARANLLTEYAPGRYRTHDLLASYAAELARETDPEAERQATTVRLLDHYLHSSCAIAAALNPTRDPIPVPLGPPAAGVVPEPALAAEPAMAWLVDVHPVLMAVLRLAAAGGFDAHAWQQAWCLDTFLLRRGLRSDAADAWRLGAAAADRLGQPALAAHAWRSIGFIGAALGHYEQAGPDLKRALRLFVQAGHQIGAAHTHIAISVLLNDRGRSDEALEHVQAAIALFQADGHRGGLAAATNQLGWISILLGDSRTAVTAARKAIALFQQIGDRAGEAAAWDTLGYAHHHLARYAAAIDCYQRAVDTYRDLGDTYFEAATLVHVGDAHAAAGSPAAAGTAWDRALATLTELDHPDATAVRDKLARLDRLPARS